MASVCELLAVTGFILEIVLGKSSPWVLAAVLWVLPIPFDVYLWLRLDGRRSLFGGLTFALAARRIVFGLWIVLAGTATLPSAGAALNHVLIFVSAGWYWLLGRLGRGDGALPRLTGTFRAALMLAFAGAIAFLSPEKSAVLGVAGLAGLTAEGWLWVWTVLVCWRLLREKAPGPSTAVGAVVD